MIKVLRAVCHFIIMEDNIMTVKEFLETELAEGNASIEDMVEVRHEDDTVVGFMSIEDILDSDAEYLYMECLNTDIQDDGTYILMIE